MEYLLKINPSIASFPSEAIDTLNYERQRHDVRIEIDYVNNLGVDVVVLDRRGIEFHIPSRFKPSSKQLEFKIYEMFHLQEGVSLRFNEHERDSDIVKLQQNFLDSLNYDSKAQRMTRKSLVTMSVKLNDLRDRNNSVYVKEYDIVIYIAKPGYTVLHPATVSQIINGFNLNKTKVNDFEFNIRINDPNNKMGNRWINISGLIYQIIPSRDSTQLEGVVITTSSSDLNGEFVHVPMSIEDFKEKVKTYQSYEEAETFGNLESMTKVQADKELEKLKHDNLIAEQKLKGEVAQHKAEAEKVKHDLEITQSDLKAQEAKHKAELELLNIQINREKHNMEFQSLQRKNYYEERSYDRKDSSELIKFLPMIIGAGLVLLFK